MAVSPPPASSAFGPPQPIRIATSSPLIVAMSSADRVKTTSKFCWIRPERRTVRGDHGHLMLKECIASQPEVITAI